MSRGVCGGAGREGRGMYGAKGYIGSMGIVAAIRIGHHAKCQHAVQTEVRNPKLAASFRRLLFGEQHGHNHSGMLIVTDCGNHIRIHSMVVHYIS